MRDLRKMTLRFGIAAGMKRPLAGMILPAFMIGLAVALFSGCTTSPGVLAGSTFWDPLGLRPLFGFGSEPIRVGIVADHSVMMDVRTWWDLRERTPWSDLQTELARVTNRPVIIEPFKVFQVASHLQYGRIDFAFLTDEQYDELVSECKDCRVIARAKRSSESGLFVARADSDIQALTDISGRRFAFGPPGDAVLHYAATAALDDAGVSQDAIRRELIPPNSLQYHMNSQEVAKEVAFGTTPVGVISRAEFESYPDTGGRFIPLRFSKDQFRVLGETSPIRLGPVVASTKTDPKLVATVREFLDAVESQHPHVIRSIGVAGFTGSDGDTPDPGE